MKFCTKCGAELPEDAKFCRKCGREQEKREKGESRPKEKLKGKAKVKSKKESIIAVGIVLAIILCIFTGLKIARDIRSNRPFKVLCSGMNREDYSMINDAFFEDLYDCGVMEDVQGYETGGLDALSRGVEYSYDIIRKKYTSLTTCYATVEITAKMEGMPAVSRVFDNISLYKSEGWYIYEDSYIIFEMMNMI